MPEVPSSSWRCATSSVLSVRIRSPTGSPPRAPGGSGEEKSPAGAMPEPGMAVASGLVDVESVDDDHDPLGARGALAADLDVEGVLAGSEAGSGEHDGLELLLEGGEGVHVGLL